MKSKINIIGAGLAGCEAAWQIARAGHKVRLFEMKPGRFSPAHKSKNFAELVCSNSLRSNDPSNAAGLLKEEMRKLGSIIMEAADETKVPAGKALAVDRKLFSKYITEKIQSHPLIEVVNEEVTTLDNPLSPRRLCYNRFSTSSNTNKMYSSSEWSESRSQNHNYDTVSRGEGANQQTSKPAPFDYAQGRHQQTIISTGPLTSDALSKEIAKLTGQKHLYFYDSVAPIVDASTIDFTKGFKASRYGYGGDDYWNFPLSREEYEEFLMDLSHAENAKLHDFEDPIYFEGCLPIEVMAERGVGTLRHGPMKPFGLADPSTGEEPYAVIQLRQEDSSRSMFNMVGFQTRLTWPEQKRIFRNLPGFSKAEFLRFGVIHRNTYIESPKILYENLEVKKGPGIFFAGQITGVEGYIESAATGLWIGLYLGSVLKNSKIDPPPHTTALGSLIWHVANPNHRNFQPMNVNFGLMPIIKENIHKRDRKKAMVSRARADFEAWQKPLKAARILDL